MQQIKNFFWLLLLLSLPLIATFWIVSLFRDTLPHWPGPGYVALLIFVAYYANTIFRKESKLKYVLLSANSLLLVIMLAGYFSINYLPDELGSTANTNKREGDLTLDMYGWKN